MKVKKMLEKAGYVSIETVIVAGLMIGLGIFALTEFYAIGQIVSEDSFLRVNEVLNVTHNNGGYIE